MTSSGRWRRIEALFEGALDRPADERRAWLAAECGDDGEVAAEVAAMLAAHERAGGVLDRNPASLASAALGEAREGAEAVPPRAGPYRVLGEIGRGGMGVVFQAWDDRLQRPLAVKLLPRSLRADEASRRRFLNEARAASALEHPAICTIYDLGETDDGQPFIAMAYYAGCTLQQRLAEGPVPVEEAVRWTIQVAQGLGRAHAAGIIHRDVKPSNLLLTEDGQIKILDFGVAKLEAGTAATLSGTRLGTPAYMAPEQARGEPVDGRADLFSLGAVLHELLTGARPFRGETPAAALAAVLFAEPPPVTGSRPGVSPELDRIVRRCLAKDRETRYATAQELIRELEAVLRGSAAEPPPGTALPAALTRFVGREREVRQVVEALRGARLLTLTGPGGTGKTRLALEAARAAAEAFPGGVHFIALDPVREPGRVASAIASALGVGETATQTAAEALEAFLRPRRCLLVLDNFEQVVEAARLVVDLLTRCPGLTVLTTSRLLLRVSGERVYPVPPLELPAEGAAVTAVDLEGYAATALFLDRARSSEPDFAVSDEEAPLVAEICRRLDGLPLAIELAAARSRHFSPRTLLARLERRLELTGSAPRDSPERHQTLRQAVAWSHDLLEEPHRLLFRRLSVFVGSFTAEAVTAVMADAGWKLPEVLEGISLLLDHSLVQRDPQRDLAGEGRFLILDTLREYARERLEEAGEEAATARAHALFYRALAERARDHLTGPEQGRWLDLLETDHGNLAAALDWAQAASDAETGLRLGAAVWRFCLSRGYLREGRALLERMVSLGEARRHTGPLAQALHGLGTLLNNLGDNQAAFRHLESSLALHRELGDRAGLATLLNSLSWVASEVSELERAKLLAQEALALHRELADRRGEALSLNNLGWVAVYQADYDTARELFQQSLALRREIGDQRGVAFALSNLAWAEERMGRFDEAAKCLEEAEGLLGVLDDRLLPGWTLTIQALVAHDRGDHAGALSVLERAIAIWQESGNISGLAFALNVLAGSLLELGCYDEAERALSEGGAVARRVGSPWLAAWNDLVRARLELARGRRDEAETAARRSLETFQRLHDPRGAAEAEEALAAVAEPP